MLTDDADRGEGGICDGEKGVGMCILWQDDQ